MKGAEGSLGCGLGGDGGAGAWGECLRVSPGVGKERENLTGEERQEEEFKDGLYLIKQLRQERQSPLEARFNKQF